MELVQGTRSEGPACLEGMLQVPLLMLYLSSPLFSFSGFPFLFLVVFTFSGCLLIVIFCDVENGFADCNFLRCRERFC